MKKEVAEVEFTILMHKPATSGDRNGNSSRIKDSRRLSVGGRNSVQCSTVDRV